MLDLNFKVVATKKLDKYGKLTGTIFTINDVKICETELGSAAFCGQKSIIRNIRKKTMCTCWYISNIKDLTGKSPITFDTNSDFVNYHPNTTYGNQGRALTKKEVVERMKTFITKHT